MGNPTIYLNDRYALDFSDDMIDYGMDYNGHWTVLEIDITPERVVELLRNVGDVEFVIKTLERR